MMRGWTKLQTAPWIVVTCFFLMGCGEVASKIEEAEENLKQIKSKFLSTTLGLPVFSGDIEIKLTNITGKADSAVIPIKDPGALTHSCGYVIYQANDQQGEIAVAGRTYADFDLAAPPAWSHGSEGLRCQGGQANFVQIYASYYDLHLSVAGNSQTIRIAAGDISPYKKGDVLIDVAGTFYWFDTGNATLVPETSSRPAQAKRLEDAVQQGAGVPDNRQILAGIMVPTIDADGKQIDLDVNETISSVEIDFETGDAALKIENVTTAKDILQSFDMGLFRGDLTKPGLRARVKLGYEN